MSGQRSKKNVGEQPKPSVAEAGRLGGLAGGRRGGKRRAELLSSEELSRIARLGGQARQSKLRKARELIRAAPIPKKDLMVPIR